MRFNLIVYFGNTAISVLFLSSTACSTSVEEVSKSTITPPTISAFPSGGLYTEAINVELKCQAATGKTCTIYYYTKVNDGIESKHQVYTTAIELESNKTNVLTYWGDDGDIRGDVFSQEYIIDMVKPIVISVEPVSNSSIGPTESILLSFKETMNPQKLVLRGTMQSQSNGGTFSSTIVENDTLVISPSNVWDFGTQTLELDVLDLAGNPIDTEKLNYTVLDPANDKDSPVTTITPTKLEHNTAFEVSFNCTDTGGSGCAKIWYCTDCSDPVSFGRFFDLSTTPSPMLTVSNSLTLKYKSEDKNGNIGNTQSTVYIVEDLSPVTNISVLGSDGPFNTFITVTLTCTDSLITPIRDNSGCDRIVYYRDKTTPLNFFTSPSIPSIEIIIDNTTSLNYQSIDKAGNSEQLYSQDYVIDLVSPVYAVNFSSGSTIYDLSSIVFTFDETMNTNPSALILSGTMSSQVDAIWSSTQKNLYDTLTIKTQIGWFAGKGNTLSATISDIAGNVITTASLTYTILLSAMNDTGITTCSNSNAIGLICNDSASGTTSYPGQDAEQGRDAMSTAGLLLKSGGGRAGFDFTKLDGAGKDLANTATLWSCVRDNVTGLIWEVKTADGSLHDKNWSYTWYNSTGINDGGNAGTEDGGSCSSATTNCNTEAYVMSINDASSAGFCGYNNGWRLPRANELFTLVDNSVVSPEPTVDTGWFPNTVASDYWASSPQADNSSLAWYVGFGSGHVSDTSKSFAKKVRLVRGGR